MILVDIHTYVAHHCITSFTRRHHFLLIAFCFASGAAATTKVKKLMLLHFASCL